MAKTNTEKPTGIAQKKKETAVQTPKKNAEISKSPVQKKEGKINKKTQEESSNKQNKSLTEFKKSASETSQTKKEKKKPIQKKPKIKKSKAIVVGKNLPISTKYSAAICRFIKNKKIENAIQELQDVLIQRRFIPMKGEYAHKKGKGKIASGSGKYPKKSTEIFIKLLKNLQANSNYNEIENPIITEAISNIGERPYGRFGTVRRKRTHVKIVARDKKTIKNLNKMEKKNES